MMPQTTPPDSKPDLDAASLLILQQTERIATLENQLQRIRHLGITDLTTGLLNARGFALAFSAEQDRISRRASRGGLVVMVELDGHAGIVRRLGEPAGQAALTMMAEALREGIRPMDSAARIGTDEFALLLCNTSSDAALSRVQHLSLDLNKLALNWQGDSLFIGASVGVRPVGLRETLSEVLLHADADVYANKRAAGTRPYRLLDQPDDTDTSRHRNESPAATRSAEERLEQPVATPP